MALPSAPPSSAGEDGDIAGEQRNWEGRRRSSQCYPWPSNQSAAGQLHEHDAVTAAVRGLLAADLRRLIVIVAVFLSDHAAQLLHGRLEDLERISQPLQLPLGPLFRVDVGAERGHNRIEPAQRD